MQAAVIVFPGSNCDRDVAVALERVSGAKPAMVWHRETSLPAGTDIVVLPGGFSFGDYLRSGAMAARAPIMAAVFDHAERGGRVLGICNGFQILCEAGLLPGALQRNAGMRFVCREAALEVVNVETPFTRAYQERRRVEIPVAHMDGRYVAPPEDIARLEGEGRITFRYLDNPNGSEHAIAGIVSPGRNVMGLMPHPERSCDPALGRTGGAPLFESLLAA